MTFEIVKGDLFDPSFKFDALAQGVNTYGIMGAGIATQFAERFPDMYADYQKFCVRHGMTLAGLMHVYTPSWTGDLSTNEDNHPVLTMSPGTTIYNLFTQIAPGRGNANMELLHKSLILLRQDAESLVDRVGLPWIGCGIGGLDKHNVEHVMRHVLEDSDVEFILVEQ